MADDTTPSPVVDLDAYRIARGGDDAGFFACPRCGGDEIAVLCRGIAGRPFVAALVCCSCDPPTEVGVVGGFLGG